MTPTNRINGSARPLETMLDCLSGVIPESDHSWKALCPLHDDHTPSLQITEAADGKVLMFCHVCGDKKIGPKICNHFGLPIRSMFPDWGRDISRNGQHKNTNGKSTKKTAAATPKGSGYSTAAAAITAWEKQIGKPRTADYPYRDADGQHVRSVIRFDFPDKPKTFRQVTLIDGRWHSTGMLDPHPLYHLPELITSTGPVWVVEGEGKADLLRAIGLTVTTSAHGAGSAAKSDWSPLAGREVIFWPDNDPSGEKYVEEVIDILSQLENPPTIRVVRLEGLPAKGDCKEWLLQRDAQDEETLRAELTAMAAAAEVVAGPEPEQPAFTIEMIDSETFDKSDYRARFLVKKIAVAGQPGLIGGAQKTLKTSLAVDFVLSLGTASPFLGTFEVPQIVPVGILSGESGGFTLQETARRIAKAKSISLKYAAVWWGFKLPQLGLSAHLASLAEVIQDLKLEAMVIDPAYLCMLQGDDGQPINFANVFSVGSVLQKFAEMFAEVNCTPFLIHHESKGAAQFRRRGDNGPPDLADLSMAGFAEFARQWLLIGRREVYEHGSGVHKLWLNAGGSAGHGGLWGVDVDEGTLADDFTGRKWDVTVNTASQERQAKASASEGRKSERQQQRDDADRGKLMQVYRETFSSGETAKQLRGAANLSGDRFTFINTALIAEGIVEPFLMKKTGIDRDAYRLKPSGLLPFDQGENHV